jgi:hypothetical protein
MRKSGMPAAVSFTLAEAAGILDPALTEAQLRQIIRALGWQPDDWRHPGTGRSHPVACYSAARLLALHGALAPFIGAGVPAGN